MKSRRVLALGDQAERLRPTARSIAQRGSKPTIVQFANASTRQMSVNWIDFEGREDPDRAETIGSGKKFRHNTTTGHSFCARDEDGDLFLIYIPLVADGEHRVTVNTIAPPAVEEERPKLQTTLVRDLLVFVAVALMLWWWRQK